MKPGLGRGLDTLLNGVADAASDRQHNSPINRLQPGRFQPRSQMDNAALEELAASIRIQGVIQPILVRMIENTPGSEKYEIVAGERRWRAAGLAGLTEVPIIVRDIEDRQALAMSLIENMQREDLNPVEEAQGLQRLIDEFGLTHKEAADAVGRSRSTTSNLLRLLNLHPKVRDLLMDGSLDMGHARALLPLSAEEQISIGIRVAEDELSVRETERLAYAIQNPETAEEAQAEEAPKAKSEAEAGALPVQADLQTDESLEAQSQQAGGDAGPEPNVFFPESAGVVSSVLAHASGQQEAVTPDVTPSAPLSYTSGKPRTPTPSNADLLRLQEQIADHLGAVVQLRTNEQGAGRLSIQFASLDALDGILKALGIQRDPVDEMVSNLELPPLEDVGE